ncbi:MAG: hypothetical protein LiPW15_397 [Parcubacteria group bacterium LiPW_15]|nr:MAG: hypothetical protein LiPW15_397 [Parcubacteria group bacterium LiPW_15]
MGEVANSEVDKYRYRLEIEHRNPLQRIVLQEFIRIHKEDMSGGDRDAILELSTKISKKISDEIDSPEHENIRALARAGKYEEAANLVFAALGMECPPEEPGKVA